MNRVRCRLLTVLPALALLLVSCITGRPLTTGPETNMVQTGTYRVVLYGGRYLNDLTTVAFLDLEGDGYKLEPVSPPFDYTVLKDMPAGEAFAEAKKFVSFSPNFAGTRTLEILSPDGRVIGYEVKPVYNFFVYGVTDATDVYYWLEKGNIVRITVRLKAAIERGLLFDGDSSRSRP
ncbi:MAG: hypothetical protein M0Z59_09145 [Nitrospiraceae bacterium]|nr:hypothetical protein [Nitrospiraceae bacterium]